MENNIIEFEENGKLVKYNVVFTMEGVNNKNFVVYTKGEKSNKDTLCYVSIYEEKNGKYKLFPVKEENDYKLINEILNSLQNGEKDEK